MRRKVYLVLALLPVLFAVLVSANILLSVAIEDYAVAMQGQFGLNGETIGLPVFIGAIASVLMFVAAYIVSLDPRADRRPLITLIISALATGLLLGLSYDFMTQDVEEYDIFTFAYGAAGAGVFVVFVLVFEFGNRWLWSTVVSNLDKRRLGGPALLASRAALLWRPDQRELHVSIQIERFRRGARGEVVDSLREAYAAGQRDDDLLETLCQVAAEDKKSEEFLRYLGDLLARHPEDEQLQDAYLEELLEQRRHREALEHIEKYGVPEEDPEALERYANLLLGARRFSDAVEVAEKMGEVEGIPFKRSNAVLERVLDLKDEVPEAANLLALHAERMARRDQQIRWLDRSFTIDRSQKHVALKLAGLLEEADMNKRLQELLHDLASDFPDDQDVSYWYARTLYANGNLEEAAAAFDKLREKKKYRAEAGITLARIHMDLNDHQGAKVAAEEAMSLELTDEQKTQVLQLLKKIERAQFSSELGEMLERCGRNPEDVDLQFRGLRMLCGGGHHDRAVAHADLLLRHHPEQRPKVVKDLREAVGETKEGAFQLLSYLADLQVAEGQYDDALETVRMMAKRSLNPASAIRDGAQKILRRSPHHLNTLRTMGEMYQDLGQFTEMIHAWSLFLSNGGEEDEYIDRSMAKAYISLNEYENAKKYAHALLQREHTEKPEDDIALLKRLIPMAVEAQKAGEAQELQDELEKRAAADDAEMRRLRTKVRENVRLQRIDRLREKADAGKADAAVLEELGDLYIEQQEFNEAITSFQRASRQKEAGRVPRVKLAYAFAKKRMFDLAGETLAELRLTLGDDPEELDKLMEWMYKTGEVLEEANMFERATMLYKQLMKIDAGYRDVLIKVEKLSRK